jgi:hypothetical protein
MQTATRPTRQPATVTLGHWNFVLVVEGMIVSGILPGMMDRAAAERQIRADRFLGPDVRIECSHHTYQIPAAEVS